MMSILRKQLTQCTQLTFKGIPSARSLYQQNYKISLFGKNFRITPQRFVQSKNNNEGKAQSFKYSPGMSPADMKNSRNAPKKPFFAFMLGEKGELVNGMIISVIVTGAFLLHLGPHTQLKEYTRRFYEQTEKGFKVKVNKKLRELMFEVIEDDQKLSPEEQEHTKYFMANVEDAFCFGGYFSNSGVLIALPYYFAFEDPSEINLMNYHFGIKSADPAIYNKGYLPRSMLKSDEAKLLTNSLVLSEDAKRFAIAREIERAKSMYYLSYGAIFPVMITAGYLFCRVANRKRLLFKRWPPAFRFMMYGATSCIMSYAAVVLKDINNYWTEAELDKMTCNLGMKYAKGGVEYYDKQRKRNQAFRTLVPENAAKNSYNLNGDPWPSLFRPYKYRSITERMQRCEKFVESS